MSGVGMQPTTFFEEVANSMDPAISFSRHNKVSWKRRTFLLISLPVTIGVLAVTSILWWTDNIEMHTMSLIQAGYFTLMSIWLAVFMIYLHLTTWTQPVLQQKIIRILIMVPVYSVDSWLGIFFPIVNPDSAESTIALCNLTRDCYEAYVLYTFYSYLMELLGGEEVCAEKLVDVDNVGPEPGMMKHPAPFCCLKPFKLDLGFVQTCRRLVFQYLIIKPTCTLIAVFLVFNGKYHDGLFAWNDGYPYLAFIVNLSVTFAFTALYYFYLATAKLLKPHKPLPKFACVKAVIFLSFWQSVLVAGLLKFTSVFKCEDCVEYTPDSIAGSTQEYVICLEMCVIALALRWAFTHEAFRDGERTKLNVDNVVDAFAVTDVLKDGMRELESAQGAVKNVQAKLVNTVEKAITPNKRGRSQSPSPDRGGEELAPAGEDNL